MKRVDSASATQIDSAGTNMALKRMTLRSRYRHNSRAKQSTGDYSEACTKEGDELESSLFYQGGLSAYVADHNNLRWGRSEQEEIVRLLAVR